MLLNFRHNVIKLALPLLMLALSGAAVAQHRFEAAVRGGAAMLLYQSNQDVNGKMSPSYNLGVDLLYNYTSPNIWGIRTGVALDLSQSVFSMRNFADYYSCTDYSTAGTPWPGQGGTKTDVYYRFGQVSETHNMIYASVPVQLGLHFGDFAIFVGPKVAVPLSTTFKQTLTNGECNVQYPIFGPDNGVVVDGYHDVYNGGPNAALQDSKALAKVSGDIENTMGLRKFRDVNVMLSVDIDYYIPLSKKSSLGVGVYCDYGLPIYGTANAVHVDASSAIQPWRSSLMWINDLTDASVPTMTHAHTSVLDALYVNNQAYEQQVQYVPGMQLIRAVNYLSVGVRLAYNFGGQRKMAAKHWHKDPKKCNCILTN